MIFKNYYLILLYCKVSSVELFPSFNFHFYILFIHSTSFVECARHCSTCLVNNYEYLCQSRAYILAEKINNDQYDNILIYYSYIN